MTAAERAAMMAMRELQQVAETITIKATADQVVFEDARGQRTYAIDGKNAKITVAGADVSAKSRWDKAVAQSGVLDAVEQADTNLGRRRERTAGARGQGREPEDGDAGSEGGVR